MNKWDEVIHELRYLGQKPNQLMKKALLENHIQDIYHTPIHDLLDMMDIPAIIDQVKV